MSRTKNAGFQKAKCMVKEMSLTETMREAVEYYRKKKMDRKSEDAYVYDQGKEAGEQKGRQKEIFLSVRDGDYSVERGAQKMGISVDEFKKRMNEAGL